MHTVSLEKWRMLVWPVATGTHVAPSILPVVSSNWSQCVLDWSMGAAITSSFEVPCGLSLFRATLQCPGHACSMNRGAGSALCSAACLLLGGNLAHAAAFRSVESVGELGSSCSLVLASHPGSSLQVLASFLACAGIHARVAG